MPSGKPDRLLECQQLYRVLCISASILTSCDPAYNCSDLAHQLTASPDELSGLRLKRRFRIRVYAAKGFCKAEELEGNAILQEGEHAEVAHCFHRIDNFLRGLDEA